MEAKSGQQQQLTSLTKEVHLQLVLTKDSNCTDALQPSCHAEATIAASHEAFEPNVSAYNTVGQVPGTRTSQPLCQDFSSTCIAGISWDSSLMVLAEGNPLALAALGSDSSWHPSEQSELSASADALVFSDCFGQTLGPQAPSGLTCSGNQDCDPSAYDAGAGRGVASLAGSSWDGTLSEWAHDSCKEEEHLQSTQKSGLACKQPHQQQDIKLRQKHAWQGRTMKDPYEQRRQLQEQWCEHVKHVRDTAAASGRTQAALMVKQQHRKQQQPSSLGGMANALGAVDVATAFSALRPVLLFQPGTSTMKPSLRPKVKKSCIDTLDRAPDKVQQLGPLLDTGRSPGACGSQEVRSDRTGQAGTTKESANLSFAVAASEAPDPGPEATAATTSLAPAPGSAADAAWNLSAAADRPEASTVLSVSAAGDTTAAARRQPINTAATQSLLKQLVGSAASHQLLTPGPSKAANGKLQPAAAVGPLTYSTRESNQMTAVKGLRKGQAKSLPASRANHWVEDDAEADAEASAWLADHRRQQQKPWAALVLQCLWRSRQPRLYFGR
jgi:hypothetical protein